MARQIVQSPALGELWFFDQWADRPEPDGRPRFHLQEVAHMKAVHKKDPGGWREVILVKEVFPDAVVIGGWNGPDWIKRRDRQWANAQRFSRKKNEYLRDTEHDEED